MAKPKNEAATPRATSGNEHPLDAMRRLKQEQEALAAQLTAHRQTLVDQIETLTAELAEVDDNLRQFAPKAPRKPRRKKGDEGGDGETDATVVPVSDFEGAFDDDDSADSEAEEAAAQ